MFRACDEAILGVQIHRIAHTVELGGGEIGSITQNGPDPLLVYVVRPSRLKQVGRRQPHQKITERGRV